MFVSLFTLASVICFIFGIKLLSRVKTAQKGNFISSLGMLFAVIATLLYTDFLSIELAFSGILLGSLIGIFLAKKIEMTKMPELVAVFNGLGGLSSLFVALSYFYGSDFKSLDEGSFLIASLLLSIIIGALTFSGSIIAFAKLSGNFPSHTLVQKIFSSMILKGILVISLLAISFLLVSSGHLSHSSVVEGNILAILILSLFLGVFLVASIGGADMPVVISLLNSYSGLAAVATGFVLGNVVLIVSGALVGASGIFLTQIMCKAMNRSLANVFFGGMGTDSSAQNKPGNSEYTGVKESSPEEAALLFDGVQSVIIVPGYGMAVAQAQHSVKELMSVLQEKGVDVKFAIHPVAGRMPGHMNVLLAEADVDYAVLKDLEEIKNEFKNTDVVYVIGANDVVNPAATEDKDSPIYGMPILPAHEARTVITVKRSLSAGFAGIKNGLFERDNCVMIFDDAKAATEKIIKEIQEL